MLFLIFMGQIILNALFNNLDFNFLIKILYVFVNLFLKNNKFVFLLLNNVD